MKLHYVEEVLRATRGRYGVYPKMLHEFRESGENAAEIKELSTKASDVYNAVRQAVIRAGITDVAVSMREGRIFLIRKEG